MSADRRLVDRFAGLAREVYPDEVLRQERAVRSALNDDGTVRSDALVAALPWQRIDFHLAGPVVVGTNRGGMFEIPQGGVIRRVSARARLAPSSGPFTSHLAVNGNTVDSGSIQEGTNSVTSGAAIPVPPGGVVSIHVTAAGDAEDVTISVFYSVGSGGTA